MRTALLLAAALPLLSCTKTITLLKTGDPCTDDTQCSSTEYCIDLTCTHNCTKQLDCPDGFDCGLAKAAATMPVCFKTTWDTTTPGGYGESCAAAAMDCGGTNPCAAGFQCRALLKCDPQAFCTKACTVDTDCPPSFFCDTEPDMMTHVCLERGYCDDCVLDDQCPMGYVCASNSKGDHFCGKSCASDDDCPRPLGGSFFQKCQSSDKGSICQPAPGAANMSVPNLCHGTSALMGLPDNGICAGCRAGHPDDCTSGKCFADQFTSEQFCTQSCTVKINMVGTQFKVDPTSDSCPTNSFCAFGAAVPNPCNPSCTVQGLCAGDFTYGESDPTCYP